MLTSFVGIIGPGLLVNSGSALREGGPAGALISFCLVGSSVFFVMWVVHFSTMEWNSDNLLMGLGNLWEKWRR